MPSSNNAAPLLFDRALLNVRQMRAAKLGAEPFLLDRVVDDAVERLGAVTRTFSNGIDLATPGDQLRGALRDRVATLTAVDLPQIDSASLHLVPESIDLVVSLLALQFVNDLPGVLAQVRRALKPDGLLLAAMVGGDTLTELRQAFAAAEAEVTFSVAGGRVTRAGGLQRVGSQIWNLIWFLMLFVPGLAVLGTTRSTDQLTSSSKNSTNGRSGKAGSTFFSASRSDFHAPSTFRPAGSKKSNSVCAGPSVLGSSA